jgi:hypothetical protein
MNINPSGVTRFGGPYVLNEELALEAQHPIVISLAENPLK